MTKSTTKIAEDLLRANVGGDVAELARAYLKLVTEAEKLRTELELRPKR